MTMPDAVINSRKLRLVIRGLLLLPPPLLFPRFAEPDSHPYLVYTYNFETLLIDFWRDSSRTYLPKSTV
jgi:hypothetical protein